MGKTKRMLSALRRKAPEIALEFLSVVFAVLLALLLNEWRENRHEAALAGKARGDIISEVRANEKGLRDKAGVNQEVLENLKHLVAGTVPPETQDLDITFHYSLLSSSAWRAAQMTRATHALDYRWMARITTVYDLQEICDRQASLLMDQLMVLVPEELQAGKELQSLYRRMTNVLSLQETMRAAYRKILQAEAAH